MKKNFIIIILGLVLIVIIGGLVWYFSQPKEPIKEFEITAFQFGFDPEIIEVNQGDTVKLKVTSTDVTHGIAIEGHDINEMLFPGDTVTIKFIADKTGEFNFYCSVPCGDGHDNQKGRLIVK